MLGQLIKSLDTDDQLFNLTTTKAKLKRLKIREYTNILHCTAEHLHIFS